MIEVILHVDAALGGFREHGAGDERVEAATEQRKAVFAGMIAAEFGKAARERGTPGIGVCKRGGTIAVIGQRSAAREQRNEQQNIS